MPAGFRSTEGAIQRSFGGGELAPALAARADIAKYVAGLRTCRNFLVERSGGVSNRPGTRFIAACKSSTPSVNLVCYYSETADLSILIEVGPGYFRFYRDGAQINVAAPPAWNGATNYVNGDLVSNAGINYYAILPSLATAPPNATFWYPLTGTIYEVPNNFTNPLRPKHSQSGRTITFTQSLAPPLELTFEAFTRWTIRDVVPTERQAAPVIVGVTAGAAGARTMKYVVTAAGDDYEESLRSGVASVAGCLQPTPDAPNIVTWNAAAGAVEYYVYCDPYQNGEYGYIGTAPAPGVTFRDTGFVPDFTVTPPTRPTLFNAADKYPDCVTHYKQRRFFGYTDEIPDVIHASRIGFPSNFGISSPLQDDDALTFRLAASQHQPIRHLVGLKQLVVLTDAGEWNVTGDQASGSLAPNSINADQYLYVGSSNVEPVVVGNSIIYLQARSKIIRDLQFDIAVEGLAGRDLTVFSSHLFDKNTIRSLAYQQTPHSIIWAVRDDGVLLGCTYLREQDVWGWHRHDTSGFFWSVCVVPEGDEDALYAIVRRTINGTTVRYVERLATRTIVTFNTDAYFVDCGLSYSGIPVNNVAGLGHLEAKRVAILADGDVISDGVTGTAYLVTGGTLAPALPALYSNIHVGLPFTSELETLDLDVQGASVRDKQKRAAAVNILVNSSSRVFSAGTDSAHLKQYTPPAWDGTADEFTGQIEMPIASTFNKYARVLVRQTAPLPLTVLGIIPQIELGG